MFYEKFIGKLTFSLYVLVFLFPILVQADDSKKPVKQQQAPVTVKPYNPEPPYTR